MTRWMIWMSLGIVAGGAMATGQSQSQPKPQPQATGSWHAPLEAADREPLRRLLGQAPPDFAEHLKWRNVEGGLSWQQMREKVVVIQSWTSSTQPGRKAMQDARDVISQFSDADVQLILLHTPEGAEDADEFLNGMTKPAPAVAIDPTGDFCDALGMYRQPVNMVIDRHGAVRYSGLSSSGLRRAVTLLIDEEFDPARCPEPLPPGASFKPFPPFAGSVRHARDVRGQSGPPLHVQQWITDAPDTDGKLVVLEFWATWCAPCIASIPKLNQMSAKYEDDVVVIGISNEPKERIEPGMAQRKLSAASFEYAVGYDGTGAMATAVGVTGIPHAIVLCSDWVVRWQGHPAGLTDSMLQQLIEANNAEAPVGRWQASR